MKRKLKAENGRELVFEYPWRRYASSCLLPRVAQYLRGNGDLDKRGRWPIGFGEIAENRSFGSVQILADIPLRGAVAGSVVRIRKDLFDAAASRISSLSRGRKRERERDSSA